MRNSGLSPKPHFWQTRPEVGHPAVEFEALVRIDTPQEALYYANGGILQYVLRQLLASKPQPVGA
jgi:aconitate hydratase A / 2-methylisocitrate dehydratase